MIPPCESTDNSFDAGGTVLLENGFLRPERIINNIVIKGTNKIIECKNKI